jgi:hypothetical protein
MQLVTPWHKKTIATTYLEYDGNQHTVNVSNRLTATEGRTCNHHNNINDLGDPFWSPTTRPEATPHWIQRIKHTISRR